MRFEITFIFQPATSLQLNQWCCYAVINVGTVKFFEKYILCSFGIVFCWKHLSCLDKIVCENNFFIWYSPKTSLHFVKINHKKIFCIPKYRNPYISWRRNRHCILCISSVYDDETSVSSVVMNQLINDTSCENDLTQLADFVMAHSVFKICTLRFVRRWLESRYLRRLQREFLPTGRFKP